MMKRTCPALSQYTSIKSGGAYHQFPVPYYYRPVAGNPWACFDHDGVSAGHNQGFTLKNIPWVTRFRHNMQNSYQIGQTARNPWGKNIHWLDNSVATKFMARCTSEEGAPFYYSTIAVVIITAWQFYRYMTYHPDLSMYNLVMFPSKPLVEQGRWNKHISYEEPVFRYFQGPSEFYGYIQYRDMVRQGAVANDPWLEHCKKQGLGDKLKLYPEEFLGRIWPPEKKKGGHDAHDDGGHGHGHGEEGADKGHH